jgi:hypothetical protein
MYMGGQCKSHETQAGSPCLRVTGCQPVSLNTLQHIMVPGTLFHNKVVHETELKCLFQSFPDSRIGLHAPRSLPVRDIKGTPTMTILVVPCFGL